MDDAGKPVFGEGDNREKFIASVNYYRDLVESGAAPKRVATIGNYDDFNAAAAAGTSALFVGGNWQYGQLKGVLEPEEFAKWTFSPLPGATRDQRSTGTGGWTVASFAKDTAKVEMCANLAREIYMGPANELQEQLPTRADFYEKYKIFASESNKAFGQALTGSSPAREPICPRAAFPAGGDTIMTLLNASVDTGLSARQTADKLWMSGLTMRVPHPPSFRT